MNKWKENIICQNKYIFKLNVVLNFVNFFYFIYLYFYFLNIFFHIVFILCYLLFIHYIIYPYLYIIFHNNSLNNSDFK